MTERDDLRAQLKSQRAKLTAAERIAAAAGVAAVLEQLPEFIVDTQVAGYWAVGGELPLHVALAALMARGQNYHLPVLTNERLAALRALAARRCSAAESLRHPRAAVRPD